MTAYHPRRQKANRLSRFRNARRNKIAVHADPMFWGVR